MRIAYFVHDLTDPGVARRVAMLRAAGASVTVIGFRRSEKAPSEVEGAEAVDLGRTYDSRLLHRAGLVALRRAAPWRWRAHAQDADVVMARNLEMLTLAEHARRRAAPAAALVYESLDLHRLILAEHAAGRVLRALERHFLRMSALLVISAPAFLERHFAPRQGVGERLEVPVLLVENKMLLLDAQPEAVARPRAPGPPWRIGWFGMIRCRRSFAALCALARRRPDLVEIVIRGRPALSEIPDFESAVRDAAQVQFGGPYGTRDLGAMYADVHLNWAIDYFEAGANSEWLLPNRIYEGGAFGAVPLARAGTETARWLNRVGCGVTLDDPERELEQLLDSLTPERFTALKAASLTAPRDAFVATHRDCRRLLRALAECRSGVGEAILRHAQPSP